MKPKSLILVVAVMVAAIISMAVHEIEMIPNVSVVVKYSEQEVARILEAWYREHGTNLPPKAPSGVSVDFENCGGTNCVVRLWTSPF